VLVAEQLATEQPGQATVRRTERPRPSAELVLVLVLDQTCAPLAG